MWLQGVILENIPEISYEVNPDDGELAGFSKSRHSSCILPTLNPSNPQPAGDNPSIQAQLNATLNAHAETTREAFLLRREEINRLKEKDDIEKDKSSTRIHTSVLNMIKMVASQNGERPASDHTEGCKTFLNCTREGMAELESSEQLDALEHRNVLFTHGTVLALHEGVLLYSVGDSPNNLSYFCFSKSKPLLNSKNSRAIVLNLIQLQGKEKSLNELKVSAKKRAVVPIDLFDLENQLKIFGGVCTIVFDMMNPISEGIRRLLREFEDFSCEFESLMETDNLFAAKIMFSMDSRIQRFLMQCKRCRDHSDMNDSLVDFTGLSEDFLNQAFNITLPPAFQFLGAEKTRSQ